jgi:hypothetical protein
MLKGRLHVFKINKNPVQLSPSAAWSFGLPCLTRRLYLAAVRLSRQPYFVRAVLTLAGSMMEGQSIDGSFRFLRRPCTCPGKE